MGLFAGKTLWKKLWKMWKTSVDALVEIQGETEIMSTFVLSAEAL